MNSRRQVFAIVDRYEVGLGHVQRPIMNLFMTKTLWAPYKQRIITSHNSPSGADLKYEGEDGGLGGFGWEYSP